MSKVRVTKGHGFWDLSFYPWGGSFSRFVEDTILDVVRVIDRYSSGKPRKVVARTKQGKEVGVTVEHPYEGLQVKLPIEWIE